MLARRAGNPDWAAADWRLETGVGRLQGEEPRLGVGRDEGGAGYFEQTRKRGRFVGRGRYAGLGGSAAHTLFTAAFGAGSTTMGRAAGRRGAGRTHGHSRDTAERTRHCTTSRGTSVGSARGAARDSPKGSRTEPLTSTQRHQVHGAAGSQGPLCSATAFPPTHVAPEGVRLRPVPFRSFAEWRDRQLTVDLEKGRAKGCPR